MNFHQPLLALAMVALGSLLALMCFGQVYSEELKIYKRNIGPRVPFTQFPFAALVPFCSSIKTLPFSKFAILLFFLDCGHWER